MLLETFDAEFARLPLIAILRGLQPAEAVGVGEALAGAGFGLIEVPLNSPQPYDSIALMAKALAGRALIGAGTVMTAMQAAEVAECGGQMIISPNTDARVIETACRLGLVSLPGCFTPSEAATALEAGAHGLKLFPGELVTPASARAMAAVLPKATRLILVGGVSDATLALWEGGAIAGFGIGSALFKPGYDAAEVGARAKDFVESWRSAMGRPA